MISYMDEYKKDLQNPSTKDTFKCCTLSKNKSKNWQIQKDSVSWSIGKPWDETSLELLKKKGSNMQGGKCMEC